MRVFVCASFATGESECQVGWSCIAHSHTHTHAPVLGSTTTTALGGRRIQHRHHRKSSRTRSSSRLSHMIIFKLNPTCSGIMRAHSRRMQIAHMTATSKKKQRKVRPQQTRQTGPTGGLDRSAEAWLFTHYARRSGWRRRRRRRKTANICLVAASPAVHFVFWLVRVRFVRWSNTAAE